MGKGIALLVALAVACAPAGCIANFECTGDGCPDSGGATGDGGLDGEVGALDSTTGPEGGGDAGGDTGASNESGPTCTAPQVPCHAKCVDPTKDPRNCGGCDVTCKGPASMHGMPTCTPAADGGAEGDAGVGVCGISCATGFHQCGGDCLSDGDVPSDPSDPCVLEDSFGTFVAPAASGGSDAGSGKKASPYATLGYALSHAHGGRVYVCNATYSEQVTIGAAVGLYGGLACPGSDAGAGAWSYVGGHATIAGPANSVALTITAGSGAAVEIEDIAVTAPNALGQDAAGNGNSSVAVLASGQASVAFKRCALSAGAGASAPTNKPAVQSNYSNGPTAPGGSANNGTMGGAAGATTGANACGTGSSTGGAGGTVSVSGGVGNDGTSTPAATLGSTTGYDGKGGGASLPGDTGASGNAQNGGIAATTYGKCGSTGWAPNPGGSGAAGGAGQGGGGGGAKSTPPAAGGTGGGAGGCGGAGGLGGAGGGASIALASVGGAVTLDAASTLSTGTGGNGQPGGDGQAGQAGGATSGTGAVPGGPGGNGAGGSGGAGGTGGISVCIVYTGTTAPSSAAMCTPGTAGQAGGAGSGASGGDNLDGNPGVTGNPGAVGLAGTTTSPLQLQ